MYVKKMFDTYWGPWSPTGLKKLVKKYLSEPAQIYSKQKHIGPTVYTLTQENTHV